MCDDKSVKHLQQQLKKELQLDYFIEIVQIKP